MARFLRALAKLYEAGPDALRLAADAIERDCPAARDPGTIYYLGDHRYHIAGSPVLCLDGREHAVLQAFLRGGGALTKPQLQRELADGVAAADVLRALHGTPRRPAKYSGAFRPAISLPGRRGQGGYRVAIAADPGSSAN